MPAKKRSSGKSRAKKAPGKKSTAKKKPLTKKPARKKAATKKKRSTSRRAAARKKPAAKKSPAARKKSAAKTRPAKEVKVSTPDPKSLPEMVPLADLEPSVRNEVQNGSAIGGAPRWAVVEDGMLSRPATVARLRTRIDSLRKRAETVNRRLREEMRFGDVNDPGFAERNILRTADYLERFAEALES